MFDIGASEFLLVAIVAIVVIGPKDLPLALRTAGRWVGKLRRVSGHFRSGIETMIREAELEEMERKWREQNAAIMAAQPAAEPGLEPRPNPEIYAAPDTADAPAVLPAPDSASAPALPAPSGPGVAEPASAAAEPPSPVAADPQQRPLEPSA